MIGIRFGRPDNHIEIYLQAQIFDLLVTTDTISFEAKNVVQALHLKGIIDGYILDSDRDGRISGYSA
jgi:hypothetical protein